MPAWDLSEAQAGLPVKSAHMRNASNNWQGDVDANGNQLQDHGPLLPRVNTVSFSATPTFDASLGDVHKITLTGNVTSSTLSNLTDGQRITFIIIQDGSGGHTFAWPTNVFGEMEVGADANAVSIQSFRAVGSNLYAESLGVTS